MTSPPEDEKDVPQVSCSMCLMEFHVKRMQGRGREFHRCHCGAEYASHLILKSRQARVFMTKGQLARNFARLPQIEWNDTGLLGKDQKEVS